MTCPGTAPPAPARQQQQLSALGGLHDGATISGRCGVADVGEPNGIAIVMLPPGPVIAAPRSLPRRNLTGNPGNFGSAQDIERHCRFMSIKTRVPGWA
jgi:hypothetical protein